MKTLVIIISCLILTISTIANNYESTQNKKSEANDSTKIIIGNSTLIIIQNDTCTSKKKTKQSEWKSYLDIGFLGYSTSDYDINLPKEYSSMELNYPRSWTMGFSSLLITNKNSRVYLAPGIGISWQNYFFKNNFTIFSNTDTTIISTDSITNYKKQKLSNMYLQMPIILGIRITQGESPIVLHLGIVGGIRIGSKVKYKFHDNSNKNTYKYKNDFNLNPFQLEAIARVSFDKFSIFGKYGITPMFIDGRAPKLNTFSIGITIGDF